MRLLRFLIVKQRPPRDAGPYEGMDRQILGDVADVPESLISRWATLEEMPAEDAQELLGALMSDLSAAGVAGYELLALGSVRDLPGNWAFLGYDVGETTEAAWSAIAHREAFLAQGESAGWEARLNAHGLFGKQVDAEAFLERYLASDDPDMGWTADGWTDTPDWYAVIPIRMYCPESRRDAT